MELKSQHIIYSLCRIGMMGTKNPVFTRQVRRLKKSLEQDGYAECSAQLASLLDGRDKEDELKPGRIVLSKENLPGEQLHRNVQPPQDKETGAVLGEIVFAAGAAAPILSAEQSSAIDGLIHEWSRADELRKMGLKPAQSCFFFGLPGTGKTKLAHALAARMQLPLVAARLDGLISSFLGTTARNIATLFDFANRYRCILLLDEFDAVAKLRDDPREIGEIKRVVNTVLQNLDGRAERGFTVGITNHEALLDPAIWRRFDVRIRLTVPTPKQRAQILARYLQPLVFDGAKAKFLSWATAGFTGAGIEQICNRLKKQAVINNQAEPDLLQCVRDFAVAYDGTEELAKFRAVAHDPASLARALASDPECRFSQAEIAAVLRCNQSSVSRWINAQ